MICDRERLRQLAPTVLLLGGGLLLPAGCDAAKKTDAETAPIAAPEAPKEALGAAAATPSSEQPTATPTVARRKAENIAELVLNSGRRRKLEAAFPEAQGFLEVGKLEEALYKKNIPRGKAALAVKRFDALAKGKWVLFVGNVGEKSADGFQLAVRYTPRDPKDPFGLTSNWFPIHFSGVEGYVPSEYEPGQPIAVLARYEGKQQTSSARDVVLLGSWDFEAVE